MAKKKRGPGRPTTLTPKAQRDLLERISSGKTMFSACKALKVRYMAVIEKRQTDHEFRAVLARAMEHGAQACLDEAEDLLRRATNRNIAQVRELAHHLRWKAARLLRGTYGDRIELAGGLSVGPMPDSKTALGRARRIYTAIFMGLKQQGAALPQLPAPQAIPTPAEPAPAAAPSDAPAETPPERQRAPSARGQLVEGVEYFYNHDASSDEMGNAPDSPYGQRIGKRNPR